MSLSKVAEAAQRPLTKNEVVCIVPQRETTHYQERLKAEVLRVRGREADAQVFESTRGVGVGDRAEQTGELLSVTLGPGLLGRVYDGLQNSLPDLSASYGNFLPRGVIAPALDPKKVSFTPEAQVADRLKAGDTIGTMSEGRYIHKIMVPFDIAGEVEVTWIQAGNFAVDSPVARVRDHRGDEKAYDAVLASFKSGFSTYTDVVTNETKLTSARNSVFETRSAIHQAATGLIYAMGELGNKSKTTNSAQKK